MTCIINVKFYLLQSMNFVAEDWMEKDNPTGSVSADNNPPSLPSDCPKVCSIFDVKLHLNFIS